MRYTYKTFPPGPNDALLTYLNALNSRLNETGIGSCFLGGWGWRSPGAAAPLRLVSWAPMRMLVGTKAVVDDGCGRRGIREIFVVMRLLRVFARLVAPGGWLWCHNMSVDNRRRRLWRPKRKIRLHCLLNHFVSRFNEIEECEWVFQGLMGTCQVRMGLSCGSCRSTIVPRAWNCVFEKFPGGRMANQRLICRMIMKSFMSVDRTF
jgi:hypothetical protein